MTTGSDAIGDDVSDGALFAAVKAGDKEALRVLYQRYSAAVMAICLRIVRDPHDAEEVTAEVFYEMWQRSERYDTSRASPRAYLFMVARSRAIDQKRAMTRRAAKVSLAGEFGIRLEEAAVSATEGADDVRQQDERQAIVQALRRLDPQRRQVLELAFFEGLTHVQIAEQLKTPLGTIKSWIRTSLLVLRKQISAEEKR